MVVEIRDWCQNVGEYNTYNFWIWHFGLCVIVSKIDRCRSSDPPYEIAINPIFRSYHVSDVIIQSFLNRSRWNLVHTLVARRARSAISDCLVWTYFALFSHVGPKMSKHKHICLSLCVYIYPSLAIYTPICVVLLKYILVIFAHIYHYFTIFIIILPYLSLFCHISLFGHIYHYFDIFIGLISCVCVNFACAL